MSFHTAGLTIAIALAAGVLVQSLSRQLRLPSIVLLLAVGAVLGPEFFAWIQPISLGDGLFHIVDFGVAIILFEGALNLEWSRLRRQEMAIRKLITVGSFCTLIGASVLVWIVLQWSWQLSLLFGSLVVVTGPTVVVPLLRNMRLHPRIRTILEAEGVLIDPIGALLATFLLQVIVAPALGTIASEGLAVALSIAFGLVSGGIVGLVLIVALRYRFLVASGYENMFTLAIVVLAFQLCDSVIAHSGLTAVTVAGVVVGNVETRVDRDLREFKDWLTVMLVGFLFVLLAADVKLDDVRELGRNGLIVVLVLVFVVRPVSVWLATTGVQLTIRERLFVAWMAPRGIIAAAIASATAATLDAQGLEGGGTLRALVFLTIAGTVLLAGVTSRPVAWALGLLLSSRNRVAILGASGLGLALATELRRSDIPIVFLENDPNRSSIAEKDGFSVVFGEPLEERNMLRAQPVLIGSAVGVSFNEHLNSLFVRRFLELFGVPNGYVSMDSLIGKGPAAQIIHSEAGVLFDGPHDGERWDVRWRHNEVTVKEFVYGLGSSSFPDNDASSQTESIQRLRSTQEFYVILTIRRGNKTSPMYMGYKVRPGDVASIALYNSEQRQALVLLNNLGWNLVAGDNSFGKGKVNGP